MNGRLWLVLSALVLLGGFFGWRHLRLEENIEQAINRVETGDLTQEETAMLRAMLGARLMENPNAALSILRELRNRGEVGTDDLVLLVELTLDFADVPPEEDAFAELERRAPDDPRTKTLRARLFFGQGFRKKALAMLEVLLGQEPENRYVRLAKARMLWMSASLDDRILAKITLREIGTRIDVLGHRALKTLAFTPLGKGVFPEDVSEAAAGLRRHPLTNPAVFLRAVEVGLAFAKPVDREGLLDEALNHLQNTDKAMLAQWFLGRGEYRRTLELVSKVEAEMSSQLFFPRFQALLETNATIQAETLLERAATALSTEEQTKAAAYIDSALGDPAAVAKYLSRTKATKSAVALVEAGRFALLSGDAASAREAYTAALDIDSNALGQDEGNQLLQLAMSARETLLALRVAESLRRRYPHRWGNCNNSAYLALLTGQEASALVQEVERIVKAVPNNPNFLSTLALAKLLTNKPDEALDAMRRRGALHLLHGERALFAAILFAKGKTAEGQKLADGLVPDRMLPEEWALLEGFRPAN